MRSGYKKIYLFIKVLSLSWLILIIANSLKNHEKYYYDFYSIIINFIPFGICITLIAISFFLKDKEYRINIELSYFTLIFTYFFLEIFISVNDFRNYVFSLNHPREFHEKLIGKPVDKRKKYEIIDEIKKEQNQVYPLITPYMVLNKNPDIFPVNSISSSVLVSCNESGEWVYINSDNYGFRNSKETYDRDIDSIFIGDSYTWGACVKDNETIPVIFDKFLNQNSLNLGNVGNGPLLSLATLNEFGTYFSPKSIFYLFYDGNDFPSDLNLEKKNKVLASYLNNRFRQNLRGRLDYTNNFYKNIIEQAEKSDKDLSIKHHFKNFFSIKGFFNLSRIRNSLNSIKHNINNDYETLEIVFSNIKKTSDSLNAKAYFVYLPSWQTLSKVNNRFKSKSYKRIINLSKKYFSIIDMTPYLTNYKDFFYYKNSHYNAKGYELVAKIIADHVKKKEINK